jgi:hypothetical protein
MRFAHYLVGLGGLLATIGACTAAFGFVVALINRLVDGTWTGRYTWKTLWTSPNGLLTRLAVPTLKLGLLLVLLGGVVALLGGGIAIFV